MNWNEIPLVFSFQESYMIESRLLAVPIYSKTYNWKTKQTGNSPIRNKTDKNFIILLTCYWCFYFEKITKFRTEYFEGNKSTEWLERMTDSIYTKKLVCKCLLCETTLIEIKRSSLSFA